MALSNAIVPVLPVFADKSSLIGAIYSSYFLGAFISTLPAGMLSDRYSRLPVILAGLVITCISGLALASFTGLILMIIARFVEGIGAGLFIAAGMSYVNSEPDHEKLSGWFLALMNAGFVFGLLSAGWLSDTFHAPSAGILLFAVLTFFPAGACLFGKEAPAPLKPRDTFGLFSCIQKYRGIWYSSIVLTGVTGVVTSLYPKFSGASPTVLGLWIGGMNIATIIAVIFVSRLRFDGIRIIQISALLMAAGIIVTFYTPVGFIFLGAMAGFVMIAQMFFLSRCTDHQGTAMGLFSTTGYLGMSVLPLLTGLIADSSGFFFAFGSAAFCAATVAIIVGREK